MRDLVMSVYGRHEVSSHPTCVPAVPGERPGGHNLRAIVDVSVRLSLALFRSVWEKHVGVFSQDEVTPT